MGKESHSEEKMIVYHFSNYVPDHGYEWIEKAWLQETATPEEKDGPFLVERKDSHQENRHVPLEEYPTLFTEFADMYESHVDSVQGEILTFANKYGWLATTDWGGISGDMTRQQMGTIENGEHIITWETEMSDMWLFVHLWEWIVNEDSERLATHINWTADGERVTVDFNYDSVGDRDLGFTKFITFSKNVNGEVFSLWSDEPLFRTRDGNLNPVIGPMKLVLFNNVNKKLRGACSPRILLNESGYRSYINPHNMLSALWLQFYQAIVGDRPVRRCEFCGKWMTLKNNRSSKRMHTKCSNLKRQRKWLKKTKS